MVGILLVTHNGLGDSLRDCVGHVLGGVPSNLMSLAIQAGDDPQNKEVEGRALIRKLDQGEGVLLLTDVLGATPSNIATRLCQPGLVHGVAGVNLPMLLRVLGYSNKPLPELTQLALDGGRDFIVSLN